MAIKKIILNKIYAIINLDDYGHMKFDAWRWLFRHSGSQEEACQAGIFIGVLSLFRGKCLVMALKALEHSSELPTENRPIV